MENRLNRLNELEAAVGVRFNDRALLQRAFVHRSYLHEADEETELQDNQRLEFLGDAVLSFIVSELLFRRYPERREGDLTNLRSALVKRETLSRFSKELRLGDYLLLGRGRGGKRGTRPPHDAVRYVRGLYRRFLPGSGDCGTAQVR